MTRLRRIPASLLVVVAVLAGFTAALAGLYLLAGLAVTLLVGGCAVVAAGLLVDI